MYERISLKLGALLAGLEREEGQGATEYALVLGFIIVALAATVGLLGTSITNFLGRVAGDLNAIFP
jgi:Flp pilus assembly pilin Flp